MSQAIVADDNSLLTFARALRIPKPIAVPVLKTYRRWLSSMGEQETLKRLKSIKVLILSGNLPENATWIATHPDGSLKGPFRVLTRDWFGSSKALNFITALITCVKSESLTHTQWKKFIQSAHHVGREELECDYSYIPHFDKAVVSIASKLKGANRSLSFEPTDKWVSDGFKSAVVLDSDLVMRSHLERDLSLQDHWGSLNNMDFSLGIAHADVYAKGCGVPEDLYYYFFNSYKAEYETYSGRVAIIQERGLKARVIANPIRVHQMALSRLGCFLYRVIKSLHWDCFDNQPKGVEFIQSALKDGKTVFCHDLSDATNNFPLMFQERVMATVAHVLGEDGLWIEEDMRIFRRVSRGKWAPPNEAVQLGFIKKSEYVQWNIGQPLGLYPSFPLFSLAHGILLRAIEIGCNRRNTFRILGDDVVIIDKDVSDRYEWYVSEVLKVPISKEKSLISNVIGEFAGKVITKDGPLNVEKWKVFNKTSMLELPRWLGLSAIHLVPRRYRSFLRFMCEAPDPVGLGLNPKGLSINQRFPDSMLPFYERAVSDISTLPNPTLRKQAERRRDVAWALTHSNYTTAYEPLDSRTESPDPVEVDHINTLINYFSVWLPEKFRAMWETLRTPTYRNTRSTENVFYEGRFWNLFKAFRKRNRQSTP